MVHRVNGVDNDGGIVLLDKFREGRSRIQDVGSEHLKFKVECRLILKHIEKVVVVPIDRLGVGVKQELKSVTKTGIGRVLEQQKIFVNLYVGTSVFQNLEIKRRVLDLKTKRE